MRVRRSLLFACCTAAVGTWAMSAQALPSASRLATAPEAQSAVETVARRGVRVRAFRPARVSFGRRHYRSARFYRGAAWVGPRRAYRTRWYRPRAAYWAPRRWYRPRAVYWGGPRYYRSTAYWAPRRYYRTRWWGPRVTYWGPRRFWRPRVAYWGPRYYRGYRGASFWRPWGRVYRPWRGYRNWTGWR